MGDDLIQAGKGFDYVDAGDGNDTVEGGNNDDTLIGGQGEDVLNGEQGFDYIDGGDGNDILYGGKQSDTLIGGQGEDLFVIDLAGTDTIQDFEVGIDIIGLSGGLTDSEITISGEDNASIDYNNRTVAVFVGVSPDELSSKKFVEV